MWGFEEIGKEFLARQTARILYTDEFLSAPGFYNFYVYLILFHKTL
jgi:hypothetical protein